MSSLCRALTSRSSLSFCERRDLSALPGVGGQLLLRPVPLLPEARPPLSRLLAEPDLERRPDMLGGALAR